MILAGTVLALTERPHPTLPAPVAQSAYDQAGVTEMRVITDPDRVHAQFHLHNSGDAETTRQVLDNIVQILWRTHPGPVPAVTLIVYAEHPHRTITREYTAADLRHAYGPRPQHPGAPAPSRRPPESDISADSTLAADERVAALTGLLNDTVTGPLHAGAASDGTVTGEEPGCVGHRMSAVKVVTFPSDINPRSLLPDLEAFWAGRGHAVAGELDRGMPATGAVIKAEGTEIGHISAYAFDNRLSVTVGVRCPRTA
ncbi:hypothetical protein AB0M43_34785 [Longispora sp. NPDC051575]|uniref:hypothetical protein n=1 Tax=Longispora sp. NPDC051575 TaxID=3154943 RepID=UPI00343064A7